MTTPYVYMASVLTTPPRKFKESIPVLAFTADINYSNWDSQSIEDDTDLARVPTDAMNSGWITLAIPLGLQEQEGTFARGSRFELLRLFANRNPEVDWNASAMTDLRGRLKVEAHGEMPSSVKVPPMDVYRVMRFAGDKSKGVTWFIPHFVRISVAP